MRFLFPLTLGFMLGISVTVDWGEDTARPIALGLCFASATVGVIQTTKWWEEWRHANR